MHSFPTLLLLVWLAFFGGALGSFVNVVVYRLPRGISLIHPGSRCPSCEHPIRWYHNLPVLGWIALRGRCYDCRAAIAIRYPLVEAITAVLFVALALAGPLPALTDVAAPAPFDPVAEPEASLTQLWTALAFRAAWLTTLFCLALTELDSRPTSDTRAIRSVVSVTLFFGILVPCVWPHLSEQFDIHADVNTNRIEALITAFKGGLTGFLLGVLTLPATGFGPAGARGRAIAAGNLTLVGVFLGWQAIALIGSAAALVHFAVAVLARGVPKMPRVPWSMLLFPLAVLALVGEHRFADLTAGMTTSLGRATLPAAFLVVFVLSALTRATAPRLSP